MSRNLKKENENLVGIIALHPEGISLREVLHLLPNIIPKRTLQYRLSNLVKTGILKRGGIRRNSKYYVKEEFNAVESTIKPFEIENRISIIPLSAEAEKLQKKISAPNQMRQHVSYRREFLDSYEPNTTFYLSQPVLEKLFKLGNGTEKERPAGTFARKIYQRLLIDLSWNSSRLEGNTYSLLETEKLLATGEEASGKDPMEAQMILNHKEAIEFIVDMVEEIDINSYTILNIHGLLSHNLLLDPKACGRLRTRSVKIGQSVYHPLEVPLLIEEYFQIIIQKAKAIKNPFEQSFFLMVHLPYLQPFLDVNNRVSRLAGNIPFIRENLIPLSFVDVPESDYIQGMLAIYELNRIELFRVVFVWAYERSASLYRATLEALGPPDPFRVRYRDLIRETVFNIVQYKKNKSEALQFIAKIANDNVPYEDKNRFIEIVDIEVSSLHEGNFARYKIRPSQFFEWQRVWK